MLGLRPSGQQQTSSWSTQASGAHSGFCPQKCVGLMHSRDSEPQRLPCVCRQHSRAAGHGRGVLASKAVGSLLVITLVALAGWQGSSNVQLRRKLQAEQDSIRARDNVITDLLDCVVDYADHAR